MVIFKMDGIVVKITAITQLGAPSADSLSGNTVGTTISIKVKQKSPQSSQARIATNPALV